MAEPLLTRRLFGVGVVAAGLASVAGAKAQDADVDLALALAIDCSFSVDTSEFRIQMRGLGEAIASPEVWDAIKNGPKQKIAIVVFQWSDNNVQRVVHPWTVIDSPAAANAVGLKLVNGPRAVSEGGTAISSALIFGAALFNLAPPATRRVIDLATDGRNNMGSPVSVARDTVLARGITINGLAIANEWPTLDIYVENNIAGGPSHFVIKANSYDDFGSAMQRKLVREITGPGST